MLGLNRSSLDMEYPSSLVTFSELDALTVMALSIVWIVAVLTVIWGLRFVSKVTVKILNVYDVNTICSYRLHTSPCWAH